MERKRIIKVCGMTDASNIRQVAETGVDWIGMIFWQPSSRCCHDPGVAQTIPEGIQRVGVFVDEEVETIVRRTEECGLNRVQLHGRETATSIRQLRQRLPQGVEIIKAISIRDKVDLLKADRYHGLCHLLLFDTRCQCVGGSGQQFSWDMLQHYQGPTPFLLSGGIGPEDAERVATLDHPLLEGIDLNSRFETSPALKDTQRLAVFLDRLTRTLSTPIH